MEPATNKCYQDRISQLPDPILHHILSSSFIDTKHAVRTCVLSKRWRNVWESMPNLSFCDDDWKYFNEDMIIDFPTFVNMVLLLRDTLDVHSLHIRWSNHFNEHGRNRMTTWMKYAVNHNVKKLEISLLCNYEYEFPRCVFTCPTLEDLVLSVGSFAYLPEVVCLGRLRKLRIHRFASSPILLKSLIFGCPVLEDLHLDECELEDPDISSNSIKKLYFKGCVFEGARIRISVPSLQSLEITDNDIPGLEVLLENLSSLVKASFQTEHFNDCVFLTNEQLLLKFASPMTKYKDVSREVLSELQSFNKLQKLKLYGWSMVGSFPTVVHFLQRSPNLKLLTLEGVDTTLKQWFVCAHRKLCVISQCGAENARISELMTDFFNSKCGCFQE